MTAFFQRCPPKHAAATPAPSPPSDTTFTLPTPRGVGLAAAALLVLAFLLPHRAVAAWGDTYYWKSDAGSGYWNQDWWNSLGYNQNPGGNPGGGKLQFDNTAWSGMTNDWTGSAANRWQVIFLSGTSARTIAGSTENTFYDSGGTWPKIENYDADTQTINFPIKVGYGSGMEINPVDGDLTLGGNVNTDGKDIHVYGDNSKMLTFSAVVSGSGKIIVEQYSKVKISGSSTLTGNIEIDEGEFWVDAGGALGNGTIYVGNGAELANVAKLWLADGDGGLALNNRNISVNNGNDNTRYIGGLNASGTNTYGGTVTLGKAILMEANQSGGCIEFTNVISGAYNVTLNGPGKVRLSGENTFSGTLYIDSGTLEIARPSGDPLDVSEVKLGNTTGDVRLQYNSSSGFNLDTNINVRSSSGTKSIWNIAGNNTNSGSIYLDADLLVTNTGGTLTFSGADFDLKQKVLTVDGSSNTVISAVLKNSVGSGDQYIVKRGSGTLIGSGNGIFGGGIYVDQGTLRLDHNNGIGTGTIRLGKDDGTALDARLLLNGGRTVANAIQVRQPNSGTMTIGSEDASNDNTLTGNITLDKAATLTVPASRTLTFTNGVVSGSGGVNKIGSGTVVLAGNNTYSGATIVSNGVLKIVHTNALGSAATGTTVRAGACLELAAAGNYPAEALTLYGTGISEGGALLKSAGGTQQHPGTITLASDARLNVTGGDLDLRGTVDAAGYTLYLGGNQNTIFGSGITLANFSKTTGDGAICKDGTGELQLRPAAALTGTINLNTGLVTLLTGTMPSSGAFVMKGDTWLRPDSTTARAVTKPLTINGDVTLGYTGWGELQITNTVDLGGAARALSVSNTVTMSQTVSNGGIVKTGPAMLTLSGVNTYSGKTVVSNGTVAIAAETGLGANPGAPTADQLTLSGGTLQATGTFAIDDANRGLTVGAPGGTLDVTNGVTLTIANVIAGTGALTNSGAGTLVLSAQNTYSGAALVSSGATLIYNGTNTSSAVAVNSGGTLMGIGSIGVVTNGGVLNPGTNHVGTLRVTGLTLNNGSTLRCELGNWSDAASRDCVTNSGAAVFNATATVALDSSKATGVTTNESKSWTLIGGGVTATNGLVLDQTTYWSPSKGGGQFSLAAGGGNLVLNFTPVPQGVSASDGSSTAHVAVTWSDGTGETGYKVFRSTSSDTGTAAQIGGTLAADATGTNDASATPGQLYYYWVKAVTPQGDTDFSAGDSGYRKLATVATVTASDNTYSDKVKVDWTDVTGETGFTVWRNTVDASGTASNITPTPVAADTLTYDDTDTEPAQQYYYWVRATNSSSASLSDFQASGEPGMRASLAAPTVINPTATGITFEGATLGAEISTNGGAAITSRGTVWGYAATPTGNELTEGGTSTGVFSHARSGMTAGTLVYYRGWASNSVGKSYSPDGQFWTVPLAPAVSAATNVATTSFYANWSAATGATNYFLDVATNSGFTAYVTGWSNKTVGTVTTYLVDSGLSAGGTYYYRLRAQNSGGTSTNSGTIGPVYTLCEAPTATAATAIGETSFQANWTSVNGADSYRLDAASNSSFTAYVPAYSNRTVAGTSDAVSGLNPETAYYYRVRAMNAGGQPSANSNTNGPVYTLSTEPSSHAGSFTAAGASASSIALAWTTATGADGYLIIQRQGADPTNLPTDGTGYTEGQDLGGGGTVAKIVTSGSTTNTTVSGLSSGTQYNFSILPYAWDGSHTNTYNYRTAATIPTANAYTFASEPTTDASGVLFTQLQENSMRVSWANGNGASRIVVARGTNAVSWAPGDGQGYTANTNFGSATDQGGGNKVVYDGSGTNFTLTGLASNVRYYVAIYEYNGSGGTQNYKTNSPATGNEITLSNPTGLSAARDGTHPSIQINLGWTKASSRNVMIVRRTGAAVAWTPTQGTNYSDGQNLGDNTVVVLGSDGGTNYANTGLIPGKTYFYKFYTEYYGYYSSGAAVSESTTPPQAQNTSGGSPEQPAAVYLGDTNLTFGLDSWGKIESNWGKARVVIHTGAAITNGLFGPYGAYTDQNHKTAASPQFTSTGTWYWGIQMEYGSYGEDFWYCTNTTGWVDMVVTAPTSTLTVTVNALNPPSNVTATAVSESQIDLTWAKGISGTAKDTLVFRGTNGTPPAPVGGNVYTQGSDYVFGSYTYRALYKGSGTNTSETGLSQGQTRYYFCYAENYSYYSAGVQTNASTLYTDALWDGGGANDAWTTAGNWSPDGVPSPGVSTVLRFSGATRLTPSNDFASWSAFNDLFFTNTSSSFTLLGNSIDWHGRIENWSTVSQTVSLANLSMKKSGGGELNPVHGDLAVTGGGTIFNDSNEDLHIWGDNGRTLTLGMNFQGNASASLIVEQNSTCRVAVAQSYTGSTEIDAGGLHVAEGGDLAGGTIYVGNGGTPTTPAELLIVDADGGTTLNEPLQANDSSGAAYRTVGGNNTGGTNKFSGAVTLRSDTRLTAAGGGAVEFSAAIGQSGGTYALSKISAGKVILSESNTFGGGVYVEAGTLALNRANAAGTGTIRVGPTGGSADATLYLTGGRTVPNAVTVRQGGSGTLTLGSTDTGYENVFQGAVSLEKTATLTAGAGRTVTFETGVISGNGGLNASGAGTVVLKGANTYTGAVDVQVGTLRAQHADALGTTSGGATVRDGATLELYQVGTLAAEALTLNGMGVTNGGALRGVSATTVTVPGLITLGSHARIANAGATLTLSGTVNAGAYTLYMGTDGIITLSGTLSGSKTTDDGALVKDGADRLELASNNSGLTGTVRVDAGTLRLTHANGLGATSAGTTVNSGGTLELRGGITTAAEPLTLNGAGAAGGGALLNGLNDNTFGGPITLASAARINSDSSTLRITNGITGNFNLTFGGSGTVLITNNFFSIGSSTLTKDGAGELSLQVTNNYSGATTISGGTIRIVADGCLGASPGSPTPGHLTLDGGTLYHDDVGSFTLHANRGIALGTGGGTLRVYGGRRFTVAGVIAGTGNLTKIGAGTLYPTGTNTYTGKTLVYDGTLELNDEERLGNNPGAFTADQLTLSDGILRLTANRTFDDSNRGLTIGAGNGTISVDGNRTNILAISIAGSGSLTNAGNGVLILTAASSHNGQTVVTAGTLIQNGTNTASAVTVQSGATLMGSGKAGALTVGGTVGPGDRGVGMLAVTGLTFQSGSRYHCEIGDCADPPTGDSITNSGAFGISATVTVVVDSAFVANWDLERTQRWAIVKGGISTTAGFTLDQTTYWDEGSYPKSNGFFKLSVSNANLVLTYQPPNPDMGVLGTNGVEIMAGDSSPEIADGTDFGGVYVAGGTRSHTFTVTNSGTRALNVSNAVITGTHAGDFVVTLQPSSPVATGTTTQLTIQFDPSAAGLRSATVVMTNNSPDETPYTFDLQGTGWWPVITAGPAAFAATTMVGNTVADWSFTVTNAGNGTLAYTISTNAAWLRVSPSSGTLGEGAGRAHTNSFGTTGLGAGTYYGTNAIADPNASNTPQVVTATLTFTNIPDPTAQSATADGPEFVRLAWSPAGAFNVLIVHRATNAPADPTQGQAYTPGDPCGGGTVVYNGAGNTAEHVVMPGATNFYRFFSINNAHYSPGVIAAVTNGVYLPTETVDAFAYTNATGLHGRNGGQGWSGAWSTNAGTWTAQTNYGSASVPLFPNFAGYPTNAANRVKLSDPGTAAGRAQRSFPVASTGRVYGASIISYQYKGANKWAGMSFLSNGVEKAFWGKVSHATYENRLGLAANGVTTVAPYEMNPFAGAGGDTGNVYLIVGRYDFRTRELATTAYYPGYAVPASEVQVTWSTNATVAAGHMNSVDGLWLNAGASSDSIGDVYFDETRVATSWYDLLNLPEPYPSLGAGPTSLTFSVALGGTPPAQSFNVTNLGGRTLLYTNTLSYGAASGWAAVTPATHDLWSAAVQVHTVSVSQCTNLGTFYATNTVSGNQTNADRQVAIELTVNPLPDPTDLFASDLRPRQVTVNWTRPDSYNVMVVRRQGAPPDAPTNGIAYAHDETYGLDGRNQVVYAAGGGAADTDAALWPDTVYCYGFFTENFSYYSAGVYLYVTTLVARVDGIADEWIGTAGTVVNASTVSSNEFIWRDKEGEQRNDSPAPANTDIHEFRLRADATNVYFYVKYQDITDVGLPYIAIGVDTDRNPSDGQMTWVADDSGSALGDGYYTNGNAALHYPERNIIVHTVPGTGQRIELYADGGGSWYMPPSWTNDIVNFNGTENFIEFAIPRADLGLSGSVTARLTVASYFDDATTYWANDYDTTTDYSAQDAQDSLTVLPYGTDDAAGNKGAWDEDLGDGDLDTFFDVRFTANGVGGNSLPSAPDDASRFPSNNAVIEPGPFTFSWSAGSDPDDLVTSYFVEVCTNAAFGGMENVAVAYRGNAAKTHYAIGSTPPETQYCWRVRSRDLSGALSGHSTATFQIAGADNDTEGPTPTLKYIGTLYDPGVTQTNITDEDLANTNDFVDIAVVWSDPSGVFLTNHPPFASVNILATLGRVVPNWDLYTTNTATGEEISFGYDQVFTSFFGDNGYSPVTTVYENAFAVTNITFSNLFFLTVSAEDEDNHRGTYDDPGDDGDPVPWDRAITTNYMVQIHVVDDDTNGPALTAFNIVGAVYTNMDLEDGLTVTGLISDYSGVFAGSSNRFELYRNGGLVATGEFTTRPDTDGDAKAPTNEPLAVHLSPDYVAYTGAYEFVAYARDVDDDREEDDTTESTNRFYFQVVPPPRFEYRMKITFDYDRDEILTNFPALVVFRPSLPDFDYSQFASPAGADLRFADSSMRRWLNYEPEQWNTGGASYVWVQLPTLSATNNYIWACWGSEDETNAPAYTTNGATWSARFEGVFHLHATNGATADDATSHGRDGTLVSMETGDWTEGWIANALSFDGAEFVSNTLASGWSGAATNTVSLWVYTETTGQAAGTGLFNSKSGGIQIDVDGGDPGNYRYNGAGTAALGPVTGRWTFLTITCDGMTTRTYYNGAFAAQASEAADTFARFDLAANRARDQFFTGMIDETRIENVARSSNWIWAVWMNIASNDEFVTHADTANRGTLFQIDADSHASGVVIPFTEGFDDLELGALDGKNNWHASPTASAVVQTNVVFNGDAAVRVAGAGAWHGVQEAPGTNVWVDWHARAVRYAIEPRDVEELHWNTTAAFYLDENGHVAARSNETWVTFTEVTVPDGEWARFSAYLDYDSGTWSLYVADDVPNSLATQVLANLPFAAARSSVVSFRMTEESLSSTSYLDNVSVGATMPLCVDNDGDGMSDTWETMYLGNTNRTASADADEDGVSNWREYLAGTHPSNSASYMRIIDLDLASESSSNMVVRIAAGDFNGDSPYAMAGDAIRRTFGVQAAGSASAAKARVADVTDTTTGTNTWTDASAAALYTTRFYSVSCALAGSGYTNAEEWAMYVQPRVDDRAYLVSVPVNLGASNNLNSTLGRHLARGLFAGTDSNDADVIQHRATNVWKEFYLLTNLTGEAVWWDYSAADEADLTVTPGMGFWLRRKTGTPRTRSTCVMAGRSFTNDVTLQFTTNSSAGGWTWKIFAWPYAAPKQVVASGVGSTPANQLGFEPDAYGGVTGDLTQEGTRPHNDFGGQIWVWRENTFKDYYWLMEGVGTDYDGRWWDDRKGRFASFSLNPGEAYFYRHHVSTNGGVTGTNFEWDMSPP